MRPDIAIKDFFARRPFPWAELACFVLVLAGLAAYSDSFRGPFIFDDTVFVDVPAAQRLWPIGPLLTGSRPVVQLTFVLNYMLGGPGVTGYHIVNLAIHLLAALALFGIVRRTLRMPRLAGRFTENSAVALAFCAALLWTLHPLQTEAVTYVVQRMESLMGLFYLLTLYCLIRSALSPRPAGWAVASILSFALGTGCKEVIVTAPAMLFLYDRIFIAGSFRETLRRRWPFYAALLATTGLLLARSVLQAFDKNTLSAGFRLESVSPLQYAQTQPGVILHYLALTFRPTGLCLDYQWPIATRPMDIVPGAIVIGILLLATAAALAWRPTWGFLGAWFFLILAPTSSILPIKDLAFEHRMYLSLAAVAALVVLAIYLLAERLARRLKEAEADRRLTAGLVVLVLALSAAAILGALTWRRNGDYRTATAIWKDTADKRPDNWRAWNNLADAQINADDYTGVLDYCNEAIRLKPTFPEPYNNRGLWHAEHEEFKQAVDDYTLAIQMRENFPMAYNNRASARIRLGQYEEAIQDCRRAIELNPDLAMAYYNLGNACFKSGDAAGAVTAYSKALELRYVYAEIYYNLARALQRTGRPQAALANCDRAIAMSTTYSDAYFERANIRLALNRLADAVKDFDAVIRLRPDDAEAYNNRGKAHALARQYAEAIADFDAAIRLNPEYAEAYNNRGNALLSLSEYVQSIRDFDRALALKSDFADAYKSRAIAHYLVKEYDKAWADAQACEKFGGRPDPDFIRALRLELGPAR